MRLARGFAAAEFQDSVCKSIRVGHGRATSTGTRAGAVIDFAPARTTGIDIATPGDILRSLWP